MTVTEMKNSLEGFQGRFEQAEESMNLKTGQLKSSSPRDRKKITEEK